MIDVGDTAPDFTLPDQDGKPVSLRSFRGRSVVLYFFPKAFTPGCTRETTDFATHWAVFEQLQVAVIGISVDAPARQHDFAAKCGVRFPLLSDHDRTVAKAYGILGLFSLAKRTTFFLDHQGEVLQVVEGMLPGPHVKAALERYAPPKR